MIAPPLANSQVLLIDMQERLAPVMAGVDSAIETMSILLAAARLLDVPVTVSEQYVSGLGPTVAALKQETAGATYLEKNHFSCQRDESLSARITGLAERDGRDHLIIVGVEAHVCVLLSALDFRRAGLDVHIVAEGVTARAPQDVLQALQSARSSGIFVWPLETLLFSWCQSSEHPHFKAVSALIRRRNRS